MRAMKPKRLCIAKDRVEADTILETLKMNGISAYKDGGIMDIYAGNSVFGEEVFVDEEELGAAEEILKGIGLLEEEKGEASSKNPGKSKTLLSIAVAALMFLFMIFLLTGYLYSR